MDLELTADQQALRESVRDVLERACPPALVRTVHTTRVLPPELWAQMVDLAWPALTLPEDVGGLGLGCVELAVVCEELGRRVVPSPFIPTVALYAGLVRHCGSPSQQVELLGPVAEGRTGAAAIAEHATVWAPDHVEASLAGSTLTAAKHQVLDGATADEVAVVAVDAGTPVVVVVPSTSVAATPVRTPDPTRPWADVAVAASVDDGRILRSGGATGVRAAIEEATVAVSAETVGACQAALDLTIDHARTREQFGVPIGSFQAVKHRLVDMHVAVERARATVYFAALAVAEDDPRRTLAVHMAKAAADDCAATVAQESIQLHGGVGYTWEHDLHLYAKRAKSAETMLGGGRWHRQRVADLIGLGR